MTAAVTDATPVHYLVLAGAIGILPVLFERVLMPSAVLGELLAEGAPQPVRDWASRSHPWLQVVTPKQIDRSLGLDPGESEAIALAEEHSVRILLMDEKKGRAAVLQKGLVPLGTLALLDRADAHGVCRFEEAIDILRQYRFRASPKLVLSVLEKVQARRVDSGSPSLEHDPMECGD